jgi:nicotinate dehydrogenase subunit B
MTELHTISRRAFMKAGGAMIVAFSMHPTSAIGQIAGPPAVDTELDSWLAIRPDNTAEIYIGRAEFGQGTVTGMLQIAAEELDMDMRQVSAIPLQTGVTRDQGNQASSSSIELAAPELRAAAAEARQKLLALAAARLGVPVSELRVASGVVTVNARPEQSVRYGELLGDKRFDLKVSGKAPQKPREHYKIVGTPVPRLDIAPKMKGMYEHMQHVRVPGMLHGRVVRPAGQGALGTGAKIKSVDESSIAHIPGVRVIRRGDFLGVVAPKEWNAVKAASQLKVVWDIPAALPGSDGLHASMKASKTTDTTIVDAGNVGDALATAAYKTAGTFKGPYEAHAPFGPNCAIADVQANSAEAICSTQGLYPTRQAVARVLGMKPEQVRVRYVEGSGTFGHSCYNDAAQAAAILSQLVGKPVRVQFMRGDELGWDNYGPAHLAEVRAAADTSGKIVGYEYHGWQHGWNTLETSMELANNLKIPPLRINPSAILNKVNAGSMYDIPNKRLVNHDLAGLERSLKGSFLRSPLDLSISFASEQIIDDLAFRTGIDPVEFRRKNISDPRWLGVLNAVARESKWRTHVAGGRKSGDVVTGIGVALGTHLVSYGGAVATVQVNRKTGVMRVMHMYGALDVGLAVNPASVEQQIEGMMIQAASRMLHEEVRFDQTNVTSLDWASYPILRFGETPNVTPIVISHADQPSTGGGEEVLAAAGAAIANAFFDATGVRLYERPMTAERVLKALRAA